MRAYDYLYASQLIWKNRPIANSLLSPSLYLICHAIELTLKANLLMTGVAPKEVRKFSHRIDELWYAEQNTELRQAANEIERKLSSGDHKVVEKTIVQLAPVYWGPKGEFSLKYESEPDASSPVPNITLPVFVSLARIGIFQVMENLDNLENKPEGLEDFRTLVQNSYYTNWNPLY